MPLPWCYVPLLDARSEGARRCPRLRKTHFKRLDDFKSQRRDASGENHALKIAEMRGKINIAESASRAPFLGLQPTC
jgi:hypothetical protein